MGNVITFYVAKGGTGKSTAAIYTGIELAKLGYSVVEIDATNTPSDICSLGLNEEIGLTEYYLDDAAINQTIHLTNIPNFSVIPGGTKFWRAATNPRLIVGTKEKTKNLISELKERYDYLVIDTSTPASNININMIELSDGVVLPCAPDSVRRHHIETSYNRFEVENIDANVLGVIVSFQNPRNKTKEVITSFENNERHLPIIGVVDYSPYLISGDINSETKQIEHPRAKYAKQYKEIAERIIALLRNEKESLI